LNLGPAPRKRGLTPFPGRKRGQAPFLVLAFFMGIAGAAEYRQVPGGEFRSVLPPGEGVETVALAGYSLRATPVSNAEFLAFVTRDTRWRRGTAPALFADRGYLAHWQGPLTLGATVAPDAPVVNVSWYAARAYCASEDARLPSWYEWERAAAADETRADARDDPAFRQRMLDWYAEPDAPLAPVGRGPADVFGLKDIHRGVWEWVEDFGALMVSGDDRAQGDRNLLKYCAAGALTMQDKENYAVLMRIAMLSALRADDTTRMLGFRCARPTAPLTTAATAR